MYFKREFLNLVLYILKSSRSTYKNAFPRPVRRGELANWEDFQELVAEDSPIRNYPPGCSVKQVAAIICLRVGTDIPHT